MLIKNFERFMKNNKFKKFSDRLKKAPHTVELEEVEKKDPSGPQCFKCSGFGDIRIECENLKKNYKGKPLIQLSMMSLRRKKKLMRKKSF
jgi:hypothetical protein